MTEKTMSIVMKDFSLLKDLSLKDILKDKCFTDVTLVCKDEKQFDAHRIVLISQSLFFKRILTVNDRRDILIYLPNISSAEMEKILEFIYFGQVEVSEERVDRFIQVGDILEIRSLIDLKLNYASEPDFVKNIVEKGLDGDCLLINKSKMKKLSNGKYPCGKCDYQSVFPRGIKRHNDAVHLGIKSGCNECPKEFCNTDELKLHNKSAHEGIVYQCEQCNKTFTQKKTLLLHERDHQGIVTNCTQCEKSFNNVHALKYHINKQHGGLKYVCDLCEFKTNRVKHFKEHKGIVHQYKLESKNTFI